MKALLPFGALLSVAAAHAAPAEWLAGTVLADCEYCATDSFGAERRRIANQAGPMHDPASGMGFVVTMEPDGPFVWGRAALVGTGTLIRTDAHVLFTDEGRLKTRDGKVYFEPMHYPGASNRIEIDLSAVRRGGSLGPLESDVKNDWAIARLKEDAIEKFNGDRVFAFLWDVRLTHDDLVQQDNRRASALVLSREQQFRIDSSCDSVTDDHPSAYPFGVEEVFFLRCPAADLRVGTSGSALAILTADGTWSLGGQLVAGSASERVSTGASDGTVPSGRSGRQIFLGNVPLLEQTLTIVYLQELIRRGLDPRHR